MYESIIKNKELDKWLFKNDLYCYKNVFYSYGINTLYKLYNLKLDDVEVNFKSFEIVDLNT